MINKNNRVMSIILDDLPSLANESSNLGPPKSNKEYRSGKGRSGLRPANYLVENGPIAVISDDPLDLLCLVKADDEYHPIHWSSLKRWSIITVACLLQICVTLTSTTYISAENAIKEKYGGSLQVVTLGQSLFIVGNAIGPAFLGPLSDIIGRKWIYVISMAIYSLLNFGAAFAANLPLLIVFMCLSGIAGSTALTVVASTIADLFGDRDRAGQAMALFVVSANCGPSLGLPVGKWITENRHLELPWIFFLNSFLGLSFASIMCVVPETLPRIVIARAAEKADNFDPRELAMLKAQVNLHKKIKFMATMTFKIIFTEPIVLALGIYNGYAYGVLFLYLDGLYDVFTVNNGLSIISSELTYLNFIVGVLVMFFFVPVQTYLLRRDRVKHARARPEARFLTSLGAVWLFPITLFWFAFTSNGNTSYWSPLVAGGVLGFVDPLLWLGMLNYITDTYPNIAASAIAAFLIPSFLIAAGFSHVGIVMFERMSTQWAMATIGFISFGLCALIYVLFFFGARIRKASPLARPF